MSLNPHIKNHVNTYTFSFIYSSNFHLTAADGFSLFLDLTKIQPSHLLYYISPPQPAFYDFWSTYTSKAESRCLGPPFSLPYCMYNFCLGKGLILPFTFIL